MLLQNRSLLLPESSNPDPCSQLKKIYQWKTRSLSKQKGRIFWLRGKNGFPGVPDSNRFFENIEPIRRRLQTLYDVGLSYIRLGQPATTFSGGEAQRIKISKELGKRSTGETLYLLDEPTTGLHFADIKKLLEVLHRLREGGNTVIVIEHNLDVIKSADYLIDLGPEGGGKGGEVVAAGTPEEVAQNENSYTGKFLRDVL